MKGYIKLAARYGLLLCFLTLIMQEVTIGQTTGKISGTITDASTGDPLPSVNVTIVGTNMGGASNVEGVYNIVNVPVGTYNVKVSMIGYASVTKTDVIVYVDRTTELDFKLSETVIEGEEVIVVAEKDILHKEVSNSTQVITQDQLTEAAGIRNIKDFLANQAGITNRQFLEIRGGARDQTGALVNGLTFVDASLGRAQTTIPISAVEQVSVMTGGFNAEYGNFRSGLINMVTKTGGKSAYHGQFNFSMNTGTQKRFGKSAYDPYNWLLRSFFDPQVAFIGTSNGWADDEYMQQQHRTFRGWNDYANFANRSLPADKQVTPMDLYLASAWMYQTVPDFDALEKAGYPVSEDLQQKIKDHANPGEGDGSDWQFDGGFGGPLPFLSKYLGDATFYLSNQTSRSYYVQPVSRNYEDFSITMLTMKSNIADNMTLKLNGFYRDMRGVSGIRNASSNDTWGGADQDDRGGLMPVNNLDMWANNEVTYWLYPTYYTPMNIYTTMAGFTFNHVLNPQTFWEFTGSYFISRNKTFTNDTRNRTILASFGPIQVDEMPYGRLKIPDATYTVGDWEWNRYSQPSGITDRFSSKGGNLYDRSVEQQVRLKANIASQIDQYNYIKAGFEYNYFNLYEWQWKDWPGYPGNTFEFIYDRQPIQLGGYLQDQIKFESMIANIGLRVDYYDPGGKWPTGDMWAVDAWYGLDDATIEAEVIPLLEEGQSPLWQKLEKYDQEHPGFLKDIKSQVAFSPRLGIAFPVTERSKIYFNYGHFRSSVPFATMFLNKYRYATKNNIMELGNPNLEPPRTIAYELGVEYNLLDEYLIHIAGFYKDITGQHGNINYKNTDGSLNYQFRANNNYEDIQGVELRVTKQFGSWLTGWLNYRYMLVKSGNIGRRVITEETVNNDLEGLYQGDEQRAQPRPELTANINLRTPQEWGPQVLGNHILSDWNLNILPAWRKGGYFTYNPLNKLHLENNQNWPDYFMLNLRLSKTVRTNFADITLYLDVDNVFDIKVSYMEQGYPFEDDADQLAYLASLHLPMYNSPEFDDLRDKNPGLYIAGKDKIGDLRSSDKPYINDPNRSFLMYGEKRQIWFGLKLEF